MSLRTLIIVAALVVLLGGAGGVIGSRLATPTLPPLTGDKQQFVTTVQEVSISPSTQSSALTERLKRSVVLLVDADTPTRAVGSGVVITNDGLIVTSSSIPASAIDALDSDGNIIQTSTVGTDVLYGLTYLRLDEGVIPPFELSNDNPAVATQLLALSLSTEAVSAQAQVRQLTEYITPDPSVPDGIMRHGVLDQALAQSFIGAALVNDEGKLSGLVSNTTEGHVLVVDAIRSSLARITAGQREANVFEDWGMRLSYEFVFNTEQTKRSFAVIVTDVLPTSPAATAGIRRGDRITKVQNTDVSWQTDLASLFSSTAGISVTITRGQLTETITLNPASPQS